MDPLLIPRCSKELTSILDTDFLGEIIGNLEDRLIFAVVGGFFVVYSILS